MVDAGEQGQDLGHRAPAVERPDERLDERASPVAGTPVAPALQIVGGGQEPAADGRRLVRAGEHVDRIADAAHQPLHVEVGGSLVDRIGLEDDERRHLAGPAAAARSARLGPSGSISVGSVKPTGLSTARWIMWTSACTSAGC